MPENTPEASQAGPPLKEPDQGSSVSRELKGSKLRVSRRRVLGLIGTGLASLFRRPGTANAEKSSYEIVLPEENIPAKFKNRIEKVVRISGNFFKEKRDIKLTFREGPYGTVVGNRNSGFIVGFVKDNEKIQKQTALEMGQKLGEVVNSDFNNDPAGKFSRGIFEHPGVNLSKINDSSISPEDIAKFEALSPYFDPTIYTGVEKGSRAPQNLKSADELFKNMYSLWVCEPDDLAARIEKASDNKVVVANVFLSGLITVLDCATVNEVKFDDLGLDRKSINRILKISENKLYESYINEKAEYMGKEISRVPKNIEEYRVSYSQALNKAA